MDNITYLTVYQSKNCQFTVCTTLGYYLEYTKSSKLKHNLTGKRLTIVQWH